ncbi:MAG: hypothetical protein GF416_06360 [Candidatus Altiarchaeales archaeon]|nr:hypothetical protein [Candidatus Altiarchaeales archaeon]MBD3416737.1 hypothetical protein [Candidatus Altiarchaeales archaeon]
MKRSDFPAPNGRFSKNSDGDLTFIPNRIIRDIEGLYSSEIVSLLSKADRMLGSLDRCSQSDPNIDFLVAPYIRLEAVASSRIEGTQTTLTDYYKLEAEKKGEHDPDYIEVNNYIKTMMAGFERVIGGQKIDLPFVKSLHKTLVAGSERTKGVPGHVRTKQNWIAPMNSPIELATYVPPDPIKLEPLLKDMQGFILKDDDIPPLIKTALIHYQFEAIHPFEDGNGRVGRIINSLYLGQAGCLHSPILFLSFYFQKHRDEYWARLLRTSQQSDFDGWLRFFLKGIIEQSQRSIELSNKIEGLHTSYQERLEKKRVTATTLKALRLLFTGNPFVYMTELARELDVHLPTAKKAITQLEKEGILKQSKVKKPAIYFAPEIIDTLRKAEKEMLK